VPELAVDDRCEPVRGVAAHVLPDVEDGTAGRIHQRAALAIQLLEQFDGDPKAGRITTSFGVSASIDSPGSVRESDALRAQLGVHMRVVDDFAGEPRSAGRETACAPGRRSRRAIDAVTEPELTREMHGEATRLKLIVVVLDRGNQFAVVAVGERPCDFVFEVEPLYER
jgi:hypothetical protein